MIVATCKSNKSQLLDQSYDAKYKYDLKETSILHGVDKTIWLGISDPSGFSDNVAITIMCNGRTHMAWTLEIKDWKEWAAPMQFDQVGKYEVTYRIGGKIVATATFSVNQ